MPSAGKQPMNPSRIQASTRLILGTVKRPERGTEGFKEGG